ncbi:MAG: hypothetical protein TREMPRED_001250 [Tremellales sp. Tagirdzhanova-0007]|nr:MAG: hypothetical protein TREMPRED_001250 [Tremellales sp. Tagirdzhanova-0007]
MSTIFSRTTANSSQTPQLQVRGGTKAPRDAQLAKWGIAAQPSKNYTVKELPKMLSKVKDSIGLLVTLQSVRSSTAGRTLASSYEKDLESINENFEKLYSFKEGTERGTYKSDHLNKLAALRSRTESLKHTQGMSAADEKTIDKACRWIAATRETSKALSKE